MAANLLFILALQLYVITDAFKSSTAALSTTSAGSVVEKSTVNGNFSDWSIWSSCSLTCGLGVRIRERFCNNPKPAYGGTVCPGDSRQKRWCKERDCPVIGYFSDWSIWSHCTLTCGTGNQSCDNPEPAAHGGRDCVGESTEMQSCNEHECPEENSCCTCASGIASIIIGAVMGVVIVILAAYSLYVTILLRRKKVDEDLASRGRNQHHNYVDQEFNSDATVAKEEPSVKENPASENQYVTFFLKNTDDANNRIDANLE